MTRSESRELAFVIIFQKAFHAEPVEEILRCAQVGLEREIDPFARALAEGTEAHLTQIDALLSSCSQNWKLARISRVSLAAMRIAAYEMLYAEDIPVSVSINEAIELTKKYAGPEDGAYVNGVLGALARKNGLPAPAAGSPAEGAADAGQPEKGQPAPAAGLPAEGLADAGQPEEEKEPAL